VTEHARYGEDELDAPVHSPLIPIQRTYPLVVVEEPGNGFPAEEVWRKAFEARSFFQQGRLEPKDRRTSFRMVRSGNAVYIYIDCATPEGGQQKGESVEVYVTGSEKPDFPYLAVTAGSDGSCTSGVVARPYTWWAWPPLDPVAQGAVRCAVHSQASRWQVELTLDARLLDIPCAGFFLNVVRRHADGSAFAWCDLGGGPPSQVELFGHAVAVDDPAPWRNGLVLPAMLAVGSNRLQVKRPDPTLAVRVGKETFQLDETGEIVLTVPERGPIDLHLVREDGSVLASYHADVARPFLLSAREAFLPPEADEFSLDVVLNVTGTDCVVVAVTVEREGGGSATHRLEFAPGRHAVNLPVPAGPAGEVTVEAEAVVGVGAPGGSGPMAAAPAGNDVLTFTARHWFAIGVQAEELDVYRESIRELPTERMYWAVIADSVALRRLQQAGSGAYGRAGRDQPSMWQQAYVYPMALLYTTAHADNPHQGDERLLRSAVLGMEFALRPTISAAEHTHPDNRSLQAYLLTYELLKDVVEPQRRDYWAYELKHRTEGTVYRWLRPLATKQNMYSADCGTSTNHISYYVANVCLAGAVFDVKEWQELGAEFMRRLARHGGEGHFEERQGVPVSHYTWLTGNGLAEYYEQTGDAEVFQALKAVARYETAVTTADGLTMSLFDSRNSDHRPFWDGDHVLSLTPEGRAAARARLLGIMGERPSAMRLEGLWRCAENARYFHTGPVTDHTSDDELAFSHGRIVRRHGFHYGLSTVCLAPIRGPFRLDPQNVVEIFHRDAGCLLNAGNSMSQPEAGTFFRRLTRVELEGSSTAPRVDYLPITASIAGLPQGHDLSLSYWSFNARVAVHLLSPVEARLVVTARGFDGDEPVVFNFFPGVRSAEEVEADGRVLRFRGVTFRGSRAFQVHREFRLWNPYQQDFNYTHKPVRCWVELQPDETFVLDLVLA